MSVPFLPPAVGLLLGVITAKLLTIPLFVTILCLTFLSSYLFYTRGHKFFPWLLGLSFFLLGVIAGDVRRDKSVSGLSSLIPHSENVRLIGNVLSEPEMKRYGKKETLSFVLQATSALQFQDELRREINVKERIQVFLHQPGEIPTLGDKVRIWGKLETPKPVLNPGQFDYGAYLKNQDIAYLLRSYGSKTLRVLATGKLHPFRSFVLRVRGGIDLEIKKQYDGHAESLFRALVIGKRKDISPDLRDVFMKTGTAHLLAISGLHMGLFAGALFFLLLLLRLGQKQAAIASLFLVTIYIFVAGAGIPIQRAGVMSMLVFSAVLLERKTSPLNTFCLVLCLLLLFNPKIVSSIAFQLSFISVLSLVLWIRNFEEAWKGAEIFMRSFVVLAGTFPLVLYHFNIISLMSVLTNSLAIPLFHLALLNVFAGLIFSKLMWISIFFQTLAKGSLWLGMKWIELCAVPDWGYFFVQSPSKGLIFIYYACLLCVWFVLKNPKTRKSFLKPLAVAGTLCVASMFFISPRHHSFELTQLSSGKNEIYHLNFFDKAHWLINSGRGAPSSQVKWVLEPYLKSKGINRIEGVVLMDDYAKHRGGIPALKNNFSLRSLFHPRRAKRLNALPKYWFPRKSHLLGSDEVLRDGQILFHVIGETKDSLLILLEQEGVEYLFVPKFSEELLRIFEREKESLVGVDVLLLTSDSTLNHDSMHALFDWMDPEVVLMAQENEKLKAFLSERDITLLNPIKKGAISLKRAKSDVWHARHVQINAFLGSTGIKA